MSHSHTDLHPNGGYSKLNKLQNKYKLNISTIKLLKAWTDFDWLLSFNLCSRISLYRHQHMLAATGYSHTKKRFISKTPECTEVSYRLLSVSAFYCFSFAREKVLNFFSFKEHIISLKYVVSVTLVYF